MTTDGLLTRPPGAELPPDDQLVDLVRDVWVSFLELDGEELLESAGPDGDVAWATGSVSVSGAWRGHVVVSLSPELARTAAVAMLAADEVGEDDVSDAIGEIANIVGGTVKSLVPGPADLSLPHVTLRGGAPHFPGCAAVRRIDISWRGQPLRLTVWSAHDNSPEGVAA